MLIKDSTLQQFEFFPAGAKHMLFSFLTIGLPPYFALGSTFQPEQFIPSS
jgi:hypothetical protein